MRLLTTAPLQHLSNDVLLRIQGYMHANLLHINKDKSCCMYFPPNIKYINFNNAKPKNNKGKGSTSDPAIQPAVKHLPDGIQSSIAHDVTHLLHSPPTAKSNLQPHVQLALKNLKTKTQRLKILPTDKGNSIVILTHKQYYDKVQQHIDEGPYTEFFKDPASKLPSKLDRILKRLLTDNKITKSFYDSCRNLHPNYMAHLKFTKLTVPFAP